MTFWEWLFSLIRPKPKPKPKPTPHPPPKPAPAPTGLGAALLASTNAARQHAGLAPLRLDPRLQAAAAGHASEMAATGIVSHAGFPGRLGTAGYPYAAAAENVAEGQPSPQAVIDAWLADAPHRENLMGPYRDMGGSGAQAANGGWYWCVDYGTQQG